MQLYQSAGILALSLVASARLGAHYPNQNETPLLYDLEPGDHLQYSQELERHFKSPDLESRVRVRWENHLLVARRQGERLVIGVQRNRREAELVSHTERGRNRLKEETPRFEERLRLRPERFSEANQVSPSGRSFLPWKVAREWRSDSLAAVHELEALPSGSQGVADPLGFSLRASGREKDGDEECIVMESAGSGGAYRLRFWIGLSARVARRIEFEANYPTARGNVRETVALRLVSRRRKESLKNWLSDPELQQGALASLLASDQPPALDRTDLFAPLETADDAAARQILAISYQYRLEPPAVETLGRLFRRQDPRVRTLVIRNLDRVRAADARPVIEPALEDRDYFVRRAALVWGRSRLSESERPRIKSTADLRGTLNHLSDPAPRPDTPEPPSFPDALADGGPWENWQCGDSAWLDRALAARRALRHIPGTTAHRMNHARFAGWPYAIHVPEDYRGDEPFPLLVYLSGGAGHSVVAGQDSDPIASRNGYLILCPQAAGWWWNEQSTEIVDALIDEILRKYNVDVNRVYLAGFSNGGSAAFFFSSYWSYRFAAAAPMEGGGLRVPSRNAVPGPADLYRLDPNPPLVANVARLPMLFLHGDQDGVIPVDSSREAVDAIREFRRDAPVELKVLKGRAHDVTLSGDEGNTLPFLQRHERDPFPREVWLHTADLRFGRQYWVQVLGKSDGRAELEGRIESNNTIRLQTRRVTRLRLLLRRELLVGVGDFRVILNGREVYSGPLEEDCKLLQRSWKESADPFLAHSMQLEFTVKP